MDIAWLRREMFADGVVERQEADELFEVERSDVAKSAEWTAFFVEMITDHVVWQSRPSGVVNDEQAEWLLQRADDSGHLDDGVHLLHRIVGPLGSPGRFGLAEGRNLDQHDAVLGPDDIEIRPVGHDRVVRVHAVREQMARADALAAVHRVELPHLERQRRTRRALA